MNAMSNPQKEKGSRFEREIVELARLRDLEAHRVPLSGAAAGFKGDVHIKKGRETWVIEAKKRADGFKFLYQHIEGSDVLVVGADRKKPLAVMDLGDFLDLLGGKV
jgi:Holliday junction resolvase